MADRNALSIVADQPTEPQGPVAQFRDMHRRWIEGQPLTPSQVAILVDGFGGYLEAVDAGERASLDWSFGLRRRGGVSLRRALDLQARDALLRQVWRGCGQFSSLPPVSAGKLMHLSAARYEKHRWLRERHSTAPFDEPLRTWWRILKAGHSIPSSKRISQILRDDFGHAEHGQIEDGA